MPPKEDEVMRGGPEDDLEQHEHEEEQEGQQQEGEGEEGEETPPKKAEPVYVTQEQLGEFQQRQDRIFTMLESLTKKPGSEQQQQEQSAPAGKKMAGMTQEEFEQMFWDNPAAAFERYKEAILQDVRAEYSKTAGQQQFWSDFYTENDDLKQEDDLVRLVLNQNIGTLADMPVAEAKTKLADLTRQRILRYGGGDQQRGNGEKKKVFTEGSEHRIPREQKKEPENPKTLGELIRARKAVRRGGGKAVAS